MKIGATPRHTFTVPFETDLIKELKITYAQNKKPVLEKYLADCEVEANSVSYSLTQEETFLFDSDAMVEVQARVLTTAGDAIPSGIYTIRAERCLDREVLE